MCQNSHTLIFATSSKAGQMLKSLFNLIFNAMLQVPSNVFRRPLLLREQVLSHRAPPLPRQVQGLHRHVRGQVQSGRRRAQAKYVALVSFLDAFFLFQVPGRSFQRRGRPRSRFSCHRNREEGSSSSSRLGSTRTRGNLVFRHPRAEMP